MMAIDGHSVSGVRSQKNRHRDSKFRGRISREAE
jgi:hypothetical protein